MSNRVSIPHLLAVVVLGCLLVISVIQIILALIERCA